MGNIKQAEIHQWATQVLIYFLQNNNSWIWCWTLKVMIWVWYLWKKWVLYGYDICLFHMIPELDTLKKAWFGTNTAVLAHFLVLDASIYGPKHPCGCHKLQNSNFPNFIQKAKNSKWYFFYFIQSAENSKWYFLNFIQSAKNSKC